MLANPDAWAETRAHIAGIIQSDHGLGALSDQELREWFKTLNALHMKLQLEVGAIKEWSRTGTQTFEIESRIWDRLIAMGASLSAIAMDEPLDKAKAYFHEPESEAVSETSNFIELVRERYPGVKIGDIEPFPSISVVDHRQWIRDLNAKLASRHLAPLDFYRVDPNWVVFEINPTAGWRDIKAIEDYLHEVGEKFSLIYWASDYPLMRSKGLADDSTWYTEIIHQGYAYAAVGGKPDEYVLESWIHIPPRSLPETSGFSFTQSVLDFAKKFAK